MKIAIECGLRNQVLSGAMLHSNINSNSSIRACTQKPKRTKGRWLHCSYILFCSHYCSYILHGLGLPNFHRLLPSKEESITKCWDRFTHYLQLTLLFSYHTINILHCCFSSFKLNIFIFISIFYRCLFFY